MPFIVPRHANTGTQRNFIISVVQEHAKIQSLKVCVSVINENDDVIVRETKHSTIWWFQRFKIME